MIDPSIPLQGRGINIGEIMMNAERLRTSQADRQMREQEAQIKQQQQKALGDVFSGGMAEGGALGRPDQQKMGALAQIDPETFMKVSKHFQTLDENSRKMEVEKWKAAGPVLAQARALPSLDQRRAYVQSAYAPLAAAGWTQQELMNVDLGDQSLDALTGAQMTVMQVADSLKEEVRSVEQGGSLWGIGPSVNGNRTIRNLITVNPGDKEAGSPVGQPAPAQGGGAPRGIRNNNPLNLEASNWTRGQDGFAGTEQGGRFATFKSPEAGMQAAQQLLGGYVQRGFNTPQAIINRWAPQSENGASTANYVKFVSDRIGVKPGDRIGPDKIGAMARAMSAFENGYTKPVNKGEMLRKANAAIKRGKDPKAVQQRLREMGIIQ